MRGCFHDKADGWGFATGRGRGGSEREAKKQSTSVFQTIYEKIRRKDSMASADSQSANEQAPVEDARDELQAAVPEAAETLRNLLDAEDERVQIRAAETILDRAGVTKADRVTSRAAEKDVGGKDNRTHTDKLLDDLTH